jgi:uncharacterized protein YegL
MNSPMSDLKRPGGAMASRPLHFIWIADCSGSMQADGKIQTLNHAIREAIPHMRKVADENVNAEVLVRALKFSSGAQWHVSQPTPVENFEWVDLAANGVTDMGQAFSMVAAQLKMPPMSERALPPVLVLITDGQPTDEYAKGLQELMDEPWGKKAVRMAIAIGEDANSEVLQKFIGNSELKPLHANNPEALVKHIRWLSTAVLKAASSPNSIALGSANPTSNLPPIPLPPSNSGPSAASDVW